MTQLERLKTDLKICEELKLSLPGHHKISIAQLDCIIADIKLKIATIEVKEQLNECTTQPVYNPEDTKPTEWFK